MWMLQHLKNFVFHVKVFIRKRAKLSGVALDKKAATARVYDSLHDPVMLMTPCTTQSCFGRTMATSRLINHVQLPVSRSVWWTFNIDHITMAETYITVLTFVCNYCSDLCHLSNKFTLIPMT